jgi:hypothetical protein
MEQKIHYSVHKSFPTVLYESLQIALKSGVYIPLTRIMPTPVNMDVLHQEMHAY